MVTEISSSSNGVVEDRLLILDQIISLLTLGLSCIEFFSERSILLDVCLNNSHLFILLLDDSLLLLVIFEPPSQEVNRIGRLGFVHDSHTLGNDLSQLGALEVLSV